MSVTTGPTAGGAPARLRAADREVIAGVLASWALGYDERDRERMARCFTADATMTLHIGPETMGPYLGHAEVMKHFTDHHEIQTDQRRHVTTNLVLDEQADGSVRATSYLTLLVVESGALRVQATGVYRDVLVRRGGGWAIKERVLDLDVHY